MIKMKRVVEMQEILDLQLATEAAEAEGDGDLDPQRIKLALASELYWNSIFNTICFFQLINFLETCISWM